MKKYETGKPYPDHNRANGVEKCVIQTNNAFFDVLFYSSSAKEDAKFFGTDLLKCTYLTKKTSLSFVCFFLNRNSV
jgi:hypothetical protein